MVQTKAADLRLYVFIPHWSTPREPTYHYLFTWLSLKRKVTGLPPTATFANSTFKSSRNSVCFTPKSRGGTKTCAAPSFPLNLVKTQKVFSILSVGGLRNTSHSTSVLPRFFKWSVRNPQTLSLGRVTLYSTKKPRER